MKKEIMISRKVTLAATLLLASTFAFAAHKDPMVGGAAMYPTKTIVDNAVNSKDHTTLVAAVKAAGLVDTLNGPGPFTVFAPTNEAFAKLPAGTVDTLVKPENKATLTKILTYHVVAGTMTRSGAAEDDQERAAARPRSPPSRAETLTAMMTGRADHADRREGRHVHGDHRRRDPVERRDPRRRHRSDAQLSPRACGSGPVSTNDSGSLPQVRGIGKRLRSTRSEFQSDSDSGSMLSHPASAQLPSNPLTSRIPPA